MGAEKFFDIKYRVEGFKPGAVVVVATVRALKHHGGVAKIDLDKENLPALGNGFPNLLWHVENVTSVFGLPVVVAINKFPTDSEAELALVKSKCKEIGVNVALSEVWGKGGALAKEVVRLAENNSEPLRFVYPVEAGIEEKLSAIVQKVYRGKAVELIPLACK